MYCYLAVPLCCFHGSLLTSAFLKMTHAFILFSVYNGQEITEVAEEPTSPQEEIDGQDGHQQCNSFTFNEIYYIFALYNLFLC